MEDEFLRNVTDSDPHEENFLYDFETIETFDEDYVNHIIHELNIIP